MDEDENAETFLKQTEWIQEFMKEEKQKLPP
jgi:hypothetical protein